MTVDTLNNEFNLIRLDESNRLMADNKTPLKSLDKVSSAPITPDSSSPTSSDSSSCNSSVSSSDELSPISGFQRESSISEHKLDELAGRHVEEPLLKENPQRFVLFPIEDNEVSSPCHFLM